MSNCSVLQAVRFQTAASEVNKYDRDEVDRLDEGVKLLQQDIDSSKKKFEALRTEYEADIAKCK